MGSSWYWSVEDPYDWHTTPYPWETVYFARREDAEAMVAWLGRTHNATDFIAREIPVASRPAERK